LDAAQEEAFLISFLTISTKIHELAHYSINEAVSNTCQELDLNRDQRSAISEAFGHLIEMEVTRTVTSWAEEPIVQRRREARERGFIQFLDAVRADWPNYIRHSLMPSLLSLADESLRSIFCQRNSEESRKPFPQSC